MPERRSTLALAFVPLAGVALLGWDAVAAVWFIWLDMLLANVQVVFPGVAVVWRALAPPETVADKGGYRFGTSIGMSFMIGGAFTPTLGVAIAALQLMGPSAAALPATLTAWDVIAMTVVAIVVGAWRARDAVRAVGTPAGEAEYKKGAIMSFANLMARGLVLCFAAEFARMLGRYALGAFLLVCALLVYYVERRRDWLTRLGVAVPTWKE